MSWSWLFYGLGAGLVIWWSQRAAVLRLSPDRIPAARRRVALGAVVRWTLSAAVLALALQGGIRPGLYAFGGLMAAPWLGILTLRVLPLPDVDEGLRRT